MKTPRSHLSSSLRAAQAAALLTGFVLNVAALPRVNAAIPSTPKDHVLFVGTDLSVKEGDEFFHVVGAKKDSLQIDKNHRLADVRLGQGANIRVSRGVKLSSLSATISNVQTESIDRESARAQLAAMRSSMLLMDVSGDHEDQLHGQMTFLSSVAIINTAATRADLDRAQKAAATAYTAALPEVEQSTAAASNFLYQNVHPEPIDDEVTLDASALPALKLRGDSGLGGSSRFSTSPIVQRNVPSGTTEVDLTFDVSSPVPLDHAYIVVVANYSSPNKPDEVARQISAREFVRVDSHPQHVKMRHAATLGGLPFRKFDMGLYANGQEVATNLSEKRLPLTSDQAYQFFFIDYLAAHKGATVPPAPMLMTPRTEFRRQVEHADLNQPIYATVDGKGKVLAMSTDAAGTQTVPASLEPVLQNVRFMPALNGGSPVEGRVKVTLAELAR